MNIEKIRNDFPILQTAVYNRPLIYFDNAATTQKPRQVIDSVSEYYQTLNSNVHRGVHHLSIKASEKYEQVRNQVREFIHAVHAHEIIFTRGTTEAINLVAASFGRKFIKRSDEIIVSHIEHHSNIVPWQMLCHEKKARLKVIPVLDNGELDLDEFEKLMNPRTRLVALTHVSNTLGTIVPIDRFIDIAHRHNVPVLIDGAQAAGHLRVDVQQLDCDFYCFSGHKMYGPMGVGVLYGKEEWLNQMPPYQGGGDMIKDVSFGKTIYNDLPFKFEAGTPNVADTFGLGAAIEYLNMLGLDKIAAREKDLLDYLTRRLHEIPEVSIIGSGSHKVPVVSFLINHIHPYDAGTIIDRLGIAVRTGNHCTQPIMDRFRLPGTIRASLAFYNTREEIDRLISAIEKVKQMFS